MKIGSSIGAKAIHDVEDVVRWACAQEAAGRERGLSALPRLAELVPRSDRLLLGPWTRPASFPEISPTFAGGFARGGRPGGACPAGDRHPDADRIAAAIAALDPAILIEGALACADALLAGVGLPVDIDGACAAAAANAVNLIRVHGRLGTRPDPGSDRLAIKPRLAPNGKPGVWRIERRQDAYGPAGLEVDYTMPVAPLRRDLYPNGSFCRLDYEPDPQLIINDRAEYLVWRLALEAVGEAISGALERIAALPPAAALTPWLGEKDQEKPRGLFGAGAEGVFSGAAAQSMAEARRRAARRPVVQAPGRGKRPAKPPKGALVDQQW